MNKISKQKEKTNEKTAPTSEKYFGSIIYTGKYTDRILKTFNKHNIKVGIRNKQPLIKQISNDKTETRNKNNQNGVYRLDCEHCDMTYIGETGRKFITRIKEHENSQKQKDDKSLFGKHSNDHKHINNNLTEKYKILTIQNNMKKRKLQEQLEIIKLKNAQRNLINSNTNFQSETLFQLITKTSSGMDNNTI